MCLYVLLYIRKNPRYSTIISPSENAPKSIANKSLYLPPPLIGHKYVGEAQTTGERILRHRDSCNLSKMPTVWAASTSMELCGQFAGKDDVKLKVGTQHARKMSV